ncbi:MAG: hypothetical protein ABGX90_05645 [Brachybacterium sp.]|uniref:hypothetical protein n=1 Tax=Brachybacterium sp. TaxID=1891286 RepID=UPI003241FBB4
MTTAAPRRTGRRADTSALEDSTVDHRYYDFSTRLRVLDEGDWTSRLESTVRVWLAEKSIPMPAGIPSAHTSESVDAKIDRLELPGVAAFRLTLAEVGEQGEWRTEVLGVARERGDGWISVTVHSQENRFANRPRVVPRLLEGLEVRDGSSELLDDTWIVETSHVGEFFQLLADPGRNAPVFVTAARPGVELGKVGKWMELRSRELAGLAHSYVLSAEANAQLMRALGEAHGVRPGTIRSFAPNPVAHDREDALRHRVVGAQRLNSLPSRAAGALIGRIARFEAAGRPEPAVLRDARRAFDRKALEDRLRGRRARRSGQPLAPSRPIVPSRPTTEPASPSPAPSAEAPADTLPSPAPGPPEESAREEPRTEVPSAPPPAEESETAAAPQPVPSPTEAEEPGATDSPESEPTTDVEGRTTGKASDRAASGTTPGGPSNVSEAEPDAPSEGLDTPDPHLAELFALTGVTSLAAVLDHLRAQEDLLEEVAEEAQEALAERDRHADTAEQLQRAVGDLELELSSELTRRQTAEQNARLLSVYQAPEEERDPEAIRLVELRAPEQFSEVPDAMRKLREYLEFTGDAAVTAALDEYDTVNISAKKCWDGLLALHDYARARSTGVHEGGLVDYLRTTPHGFHGFGVSNCATQESGPTKEQKDLAEQRRFTVPTTVDPSGAVVMWPHLKLGKIGRISPRLHFHDDVAGTGKVYVGYIGRHLGISSDR